MYALLNAFWFWLKQHWLICFYVHHTILHSEHPELPDAVIDYCTPPGVWLVLVNKNIACFNVLRYLASTFPMET